MMPAFRLIRSLILILIISLVSCSIFAQQSITMLKQGDYKIVDEDLSFSPHAQINGSFYMNGSMFREDFLMGSVIDGTMVQEFELDFKSMINTNLSLNVTLSNASSTVSEQDKGYDSNNSSEQDVTLRSSGGLNVVFKNAFLEYNHNPNAIMRAGVQPVTVGDSRGLIYEGNEIAFTQTCGIGTWCYEIGGARLGDNGGQGLMWFQLDYPVYESGKKRKDNWSENEYRQDVSFNVKLLQVQQGGVKIPMGTYGGWTGYNSTYQEKDSSGDWVFYDNQKMEYFGIFTQGYYYNLDFNISWIGMGGTRNYYSDNTTWGTKNIIGRAALIDIGYQINSDIRLSSLIFSASGKGSSSTDVNVWNGDSSSYYEVKKGSYGNALIYFNNGHGTGTNHSVTNLTYAAALISYKPEGAFSMDGGIYSFRKTNPITVQFTGESAKSVSDIGLEVDYTVNWAIEKNMTLSAELAYLNPGDAYLDNDSSERASITKKDPFSQITIACEYRF